MFIHLVTDTQERCEGYRHRHGGFENVNVIQDMYFSQDGAPRRAPRRFQKSLETMQLIAPLKQTVVMECAPRIEGAGQQRKDASTPFTASRVEFKDVLHRTHFGTVHKNGTILALRYAYSRVCLRFRLIKVEDLPYLRHGCKSQDIPRRSSTSRR
jgi:hypothetical protein